MKKFWKRVALAGTLTFLVAVLAGSILFKTAERKIAARMGPPELTIRYTAADDFSYRTLDGTLHHLSDNHGKVVLVDLWGTWCIQCVAEMPTVEKLYTHFRNDPNVVFLIVSRMDSPEAVRAYARRNRLNLPFYITHDEDIPRSMQLGQYPATFLYAKNGELVTKHSGAANWADKSVVNFISRLERQ